MSKLINFVNKNKPSNCVSYHDDICFAEHNHEQENQD